MATADVHFEVRVRSTPTEPWRVERTTEDKAEAVELGEALYRDGWLGVRVSKEVRDPETGQQASYVVLTKGLQVEETRKPVRNPAGASPCRTPQDLYTASARDKIGRVLDDWLRRHRATPFELLHRPDLAQALESSSGLELQHAVQKIAIPESQSTSASVHDVMRAYYRLADGVLERLTQAARKRLFPDLDREPLAAATERLADDPDRMFLLGGAVAKRLADAPDWAAKTDRLIELAEALPDAAPSSGVCRTVIKQPLAEILGSQAGLSDLLGPSLDPGDRLLALTRLAFPAATAAVMAADPSIAEIVPELNGPAARLTGLLGGDDFVSLRAALGRKIVAELDSARRLRPDDADGEIALLRALAVLLTASAGPHLNVDDLHAAFLTRSKALSANDFVTALTQGRRTVLAEAQALARLVENVTGPANRKRAANWLAACVESPRFQNELRSGGADTALARLSALAGLDRLVRRAGLGEGDQRRICGLLGELAGKIEADARLCALLARSAAGLPQRVSLLLRLAGGDLALPGPVADRARAELTRLLREPEARAELAASPDVVRRVRELMAA